MTRDHLDHDVADESHRASCAECTAVWTELEGISAQAARLPLLTPSRDLWAGIDTRLARHGVTELPVTVAPRPVARRWFARPAVRLAAAASLLVAVSAGITWTYAKSTAPQASATGRSIEELGGNRAAVTTVVQPASLDETVATMDHEIAALRLLLDERRERLDPRTVSVLEANMQLIDKAIAESKAALEADPSSRFLAAQYARAYASKITLLRDVATIPAGT